MNCPYCGRKMSSFSFGCKVCRRSVWRLPQVLMAIFLVCFVVTTLVLLVEFIAGS